MEVATLAKRAGIAAILVVVWLAYVEATCFAKLSVASADADIIPRSRLLAVYGDAPWVNTFSDEWKPSNVLRYEAYVGWERKPFQGKTINIDASGVRRSVPSYCEDNKPYTIWMFGGSTVWGTGAPDWLTIPSLLAKKFEESGRRVCIRNFGEKAWVSTQEMLKLILELKESERKPDLVIFYDGPADVYESYQSGQPGLHQNFDDTKQLLEGRASHSGGFRYLRETNIAKVLLRHKILGGRGKRSSAADILSLARATVRCYLDNVKMVQALGHEYRFEPVFFWEPTLSTGNKRLTAEEEEARDAAQKRSPGLQEVNQVAYAVLKAQAHSPVFPIADALDSSTETVFFDEAHVSAEGNRLVADRMYATLEAEMH